MRWLHLAWLLCLLSLGGCQTVLSPVRPDPDKEIATFETAHGSSLSQPRTFTPPAQTP